MCGKRDPVRVRFAGGHQEARRLWAKLRCNLTLQYACVSFGFGGAVEERSGQCVRGIPGPSLRVRWETSQRVLIEHHADVQVFKKEPRRNDVEIQYATFR